MNLDRRSFLGAAMLAPLTGDSFEITSVIGNLKAEDGACPIEGGKWYSAAEPGAGYVCQFAPGKLAQQKWLAADFILDGQHMLVFSVDLQEGEKGRRFRLTFAGLNQCSFRFRMSMGLTDQNQWQAAREGAFLKPLVSGDRVDLAKVDRMTFRLSKKPDYPARWAMTPIRASSTEPAKLDKVILPKGPLVDAMGQSRLHGWAGKSKSQEEVSKRLNLQLANAASQKWPAEFTRWGGWKTKKIGDATGYFGVKKSDGRWWLTDPDGCAFWSAGADCVRVDTQGRYDGIESALEWLPPTTGEFADIFTEDRRRGGAKFINYLAANLIKAFGSKGWRDKWATVALAEMKRLRFNTVANWSEWEYAARARFPYVIPMSFRGSRSPMIYRDFPDVFNAGFEADAADYAAQLKDSASDPALIGYFLMNEPTWGFSSELPAAGMLYTSDGCATRDELAKWLRARHDGDAALSKAWGMETAFEKVARGRWTAVLTKPALADLRLFSVAMVERYFRGLSGACRKADPNHLNLGMRWAGVPPEWAVEGMKTFDVFSINCYMDTLPRDRSERIEKMLNMPVMVGEWHFGAHDVGLPASGIGRVRNQADRAKAYRVYLEDAAANPNCVGVHWFTLYDQSALGRFDGENYNIGFLDICHRAYDEISAGAIASHERMYRVASGELKAFADAPEYLPKLFL
jgi:hypothetical protein